MNIIELLNWRYATKAMNGAKVPPEKIERILEAVRLAPTSSGLQPFEVIVISNQALKERLLPIANSQNQVVDCSHLLVFAAWDKYTEERIDGVFHLVTEVRGKNDLWESYRLSLQNNYATKPEEDHFVRAAKQACIGFATAIIAAAAEDVDCTPMEGFDKDKVDEALGLRDRGLRSVVLLPIGYRDTSRDWLVNLKKVRKPFEDMFTMID